MTGFTDIARCDSTSHVLSGCLLWNSSEGVRAGGYVPENAGKKAASATTGRSSGGATGRSSGGTTGLRPYEVSCIPPGLRFSRAGFPALACRVVVQRPARAGDSSSSPPGVPVASSEFHPLCAPYRSFNIPRNSSPGASACPRLFRRVITSSGVLSGFQQTRTLFRKCFNTSRAISG